MEPMSWNVLRAATSLLAILIVAPAQVSPERSPFTPAKIAQPLPFKIGETLTYEVSFSKLIFSGTIGELKLSVSNPIDSPKTDMLELKADATSKGFFPALFGVKVRDRYITLVNANDFGIHSSTKLVEEGKVRREQKSIVDREAGRVTFTDRDLANEKNEPRVKEKASPSWILDLLSAIYYVRTQPLKEGDVIPVPISDGGEVYNIEVVAGKREELKAGSGKIKAIQLNAKVFDGRYVKRTGEMLVWITDDEKRIPLRARVKTSGYTITVDLKNMPGDTRAASQ
jgi:hypothetical protein